MKYVVDRLKCRAVCALSALASVATAVSAQARPPIIDMHIHAASLADFGGGAPICTNETKVIFPGVDPRQPITLDKVATCSSPMAAAASDSAIRTESIALFRRYNIWAVTFGSLERMEAWKTEGGDRVIPALSFGDADRTPAEYRKLFAEHRFAVFAEIGAQYHGRKLSDEIYEPYFALAEELDIPVGVHLGEGPPGGPHLDGAPFGDYRAALTSPLQLEPVLMKHPRLRIWVMHYGSPLVDEMIALLYSHPEVYVDVAQNDWGFPRAHFYSQLKRLVDAGFERRIMFGSDQMAWPRTTEVAIRTIESTPFLTAEQKRAIFYGNAARFLRLSPEEMQKQRRQ
jgi:predicted TIM-barrel fold metal-dependent hydrolase